MQICIVLWSIRYKRKESETWCNTITAKPDLTYIYLKNKYLALRERYDPNDFVILVKYT